MRRFRGPLPNSGWETAGATSRPNKPSALGMQAAVSPPPEARAWRGSAVSRETGALQQHSLHVNATLPEEPQFLGSATMSSNIPAECAYARAERHLKSDGTRACRPQQRAWATVVPALSAHL